MFSQLNTRFVYPLVHHPRVNPYWRLMRFDKPVGTWLLLWPTLWSLWLAAGGIPSAKNLLIFVLGSIVMRAAGCVINDYADRHVDGHVERTKTRPIASGEISSKQALRCFYVLAAIAFILVCFTNQLTILLSIFGAFLAVVYPFLKRVTHLPQLWLGLAMKWGIVMAYAAEAGHIQPAIWVIFAGAVCWTVAYDTFYAMVDREDDRKIGVKSSAILFGEMDLTMIATLQCLALFAFYLGGVRFELGGVYQLSLAAVAILFFYQLWIARSRSREACFRAFLNNRWVGLVMFVGVALSLAFAR